jgi:PAS domain S-box-containing protein
MRNRSVEETRKIRSVSRHEEFENILKSTNNQIYRSLFYYSNEAIILHDLSGGILEVNIRALELFDLTVLEVKDLKMQDLFSPETSEVMNDAIERISREGSARFELDLRKRSGETLCAEISSCLVDLNGHDVIHSIIRDISERRAEEATRLNREKIELALLNAPENPALLVNKKGAILMLNAAAARYLGKPQDDLIGQNILDYYPADRAKLRSDCISDVLTTGQPARFQEEEANGVVYSYTVYPVAGENGNGDKIAIFAVDMTESAKMERALRKSEDRFRAVWDNSPIGICLTDHQGIYRYVNPRYCEIYGYSEEELLNRKFYEVPGRPGHTGDRREDYDRLFEKGEPIPLGEIKFERSNGEPIWIQLTGDFIRENGESVYLVSMNIDISEHKLAEKELLENKEKYKSIFESFQDFYYQTDMSGKIINVSPSCLTLSGYAPEELIGCNVADFYPNPAERKKLLHKLLRTGSIIDYEVTLRDKSGKEIPVSINSRLIRDDNGKPLRIEGTIRDVTNRKQAEETLREREQLLRATIESTADGILVVDENGKVTHSNSRFAEMWRIPDELIETRADNKLLQFVLDQLKDPESFLAKVERLYGSLENDLDVLYFKDGRVFERFSCPLMKNQSAAGRVWSFRDITELKKTELVQSTLFKISEATGRSGDIKELLGTIREILSDLIDTTNLHVALYSESSDTYSIPYQVHRKKKAALDPGQLKGSLTDYVRVTGKALLADREVIEDLKSKGKIDIEGEYPSAWLGVPLEAARGVIGVVVVHNESDRERFSRSDSILLSYISGHIAMAIERKRAEQSAPEAIVVVGNDGRIIKINGEFFRMFGYSTHEARGMHIDELIAPRHMHREAFSITKRVCAGETCSLETKRQRKDGSFVDVSILATPIMVKGGQVAIYAIYRDIADRKQAENRLRQSEEKYRSLFETIHDGIVITDLKENIIFANPAACRIFGYPSNALLRKNLCDLVVEDYHEKIKLETHRRKTGESSRYELTIMRNDGRQRNVLLSLTPYKDSQNNISGSVGVLSDITEIKNSEIEKQNLRDRLANAQRMESLGVLAGGVAHDLNNILGPLVSYPEIIKMKLSPDDPIRDKIDKIQTSAERAADVVQDLLTMARRGRYEMKSINLNSIIESYLASPDFNNLKAKQPDIGIKLLLDQSIPSIYGSSSHLSKVLMNLVINAFDAMPRKGTLTLRTECRFMEKLIGGFSNIEGGNYVILSVIDSGIGISENDLRHIFEPFYSKKKLSRSGSGLGLAIVYGVIKDHNGYIDIKSEVNKGTDFYIYFPVDSTKAKIEEKTDIIDIRGSENILVVDDVREQRELAATVLSSLGYNVETVASGEEAIGYLKARSADVVVLDMIMEPGMDGLDTYKKIIDIHPGQRAIIVSGFSETDRVREAGRIGVGKYVRKPYTMQKLGKAIREVLAGSTDKKNKTRYRFHTGKIET